MNEQNTTSLRQTSNFVNIVGYLKKLDLKDSVSDQVPVISGSLTVHVPPNSDHVINYYERATNKSNGAPNRRYTALQTIRKEYVSMADLMSPPANRSLSDAMAECSKIAVTAELSRNEYNGQNGFESRVSLRGRNATRVENEFTPKADFAVECYIDKVTDEFRDGEETGRKVVDIYTVDYTGAVLPQTFIVGTDLVDAFEANYEVGQTAEFFGDIVNSLTVVAPPQGGFGRQRERTYRVRELVIMGGNPPYSEEDKRSLNRSAIRAAVEVRMNETIPAIMAKERNSAPANPVSVPNMGFGAPAVNSELAQAADNFRF